MGERIALIEAGSPGLNIYSHVAMGRGVPLLATVVHHSGYDVRAFIEDISGKDSIDWEWVCSADFVGFSTITCTLPRTLELVERVRSGNPAAVIIFGGPESTCHPCRSFECGADYVLKGEAEHTLPQLLDVLTGNSAEGMQDISGLMWRDEHGSVVEGLPMRQLTANELDALPPVDRTLIHAAHEASVASVWRTRGCPGECDFCEVRELYPRCVARSDERTLEELMAAQSDGYATTFLIDDNAAANKGAFVRFLESIAERGYARMLVIQMRADAVFRSDGRLDREFLRLLKKAAGVTVVCVGVESATDTNLEALRKHADARRTARALKAMRRRGLLVHGMFIALKNDTRETIAQNGTYARRYVTSLQYLFETPLPGTSRTREHEAEGSLMFSSIRDLGLYDGMHVVLQPHKMSAEEMQTRVLREYRKFYSTARIVEAALGGAFLRFRLLARGQRAYLRQVRGVRRLRLWLRMHVEYRFAPVAFIATGRMRIKRMLRDAEYAAYLERIRTLAPRGVETTGRVHSGSSTKVRT